MLKRIVATIYKSISEVGRNKDIQCRTDRSLFRPVSIYFFIALLYLRAAAGFWQLPFDISANFIRKQSVKRHTILPYAFRLIPSIRKGTFLHRRAPPPRFELYGFHEISSDWEEMYERLQKYRLRTEQTQQRHRL